MTIYLRIHFQLEGKYEGQKKKKKCIQELIIFYMKLSLFPFKLEKKNDKPCSLSLLYFLLNKINNVKNSIYIVTKIETPKDFFIIFNHK